MTIASSPMEGFRLSPQQEIAWPRRRSAAGAPVVQGVLELPAGADPGRLEAILSAAVERHEILRTRLVASPGLALPLQVIDEPAPVALERLGARDAATRVERLAAERSRVGDDDGPGWTALLVDGDPAAELVLTARGLLLDPASLRLLADEVAAALASRGPAVEEVDEPVQYADVADVFHEWIEDGREVSGDAPWNRDDLGFLERWGATAGEDTDEETAVALLERDTVAALETLARDADTGVETVLLAAWAAVAARSTSEATPVVATAFDGRSDEELAHVLGLLVRHLPLAIPVAADATFVQLVTTTAAAHRRSAELQEVYEPGDRPVPGGSLGHAWVWPVGFATVSVESLAGGARYRPIASRLDRFGHHLEVSSTPGALELAVTTMAGSGRFTRGAEELLGRLERFLAAALADPARPVSHLALLGADEEARLLAGLDGGPAQAVAAGDDPADVLIGLHRQAAARPEGAALVDRTGAGGTVSYGELLKSVESLAAALRARGVGPGDLVAVGLPRGIDLVVSLLAVLEAGAAYLPLDPAHPAERLATMVADASPTALVTDGDSLPPGLAAGLTVVAPDAVEEPASARSVRAGGSSPDGQDLAYVLYTSGSTGRPKGVMVSRRGLAAYLGWAAGAYGLGPGSRVALHSPVGFDLTVTSLLLPLVTGATVELVDEARGVEALAAAVEKTGSFDLIKLTPSHLEVLSRVLPADRLAAAAGTFVLGGEELLAERLEPWRGTATRRTRLINEYGPTETVVGCAVHEVVPDDPSTGPVPIGRALAGARLQVVDRAGLAVPEAVAGELWIGGAGVARGYVGRPGLTAERFVPDATAPEPGARAYKSGDLVDRSADGALVYRGRIDHQVKIRGFRIEPGEVEAALESHPRLAAAAVVAVAGDGASGDRLVAYVVAADGAGAAPSAEELAAHLGGLLPDGMVPSLFVPLDALPLTPHGKLDRAALPDPDETALAAPYAPPQSLVEELLAEVWARILGVERVGVDDHFFHLGGDSIRSLRVIALARERGVELAVQEIFDHPTVRRLAAWLEERGAEASDRPTLPDRPFPTDPTLAERLGPEIEDAYPASRLQEGMLFHSELRPDTGIFHDYHSFRIRVPYRRQELERALRTVTARHPALRTSFDLGAAEGPLQLVHRQVEPVLIEDDLSHLDPESARQGIADWLDRERLTPFDPAVAPLVRFAVHQLGSEEIQLTLSFHHAVLDGWSAASLLTELFGRAMTAAGSGGEGTAPPESTFRRFVLLERSVLDDPAAEEFWRRHLALGEPAPVSGRGDAAPAERRSGRLLVELDDGVAEGLARLARETALPLKSVLLAAHFRVLAHLTGSAAPITGLVTSGRPEEPDGDRVLGLFLNTLPLALPLDGGSWKELARAAFDLERESLPYRRYPLAEIVRRSGGARPFDTAFNFMHYHVYRQLEEITGATVVERTGYEETDLPLTAHLALEPSTGALSLAFNYQVAEMGPERVDEVARLWRVVLGAMVARPEERWEATALLSEAEARQIRVWNDTPVHPGAVSLHGPVFDRARETPERVALRAGGRDVTYGELARRARGLASRLAAVGVGPEDRVAVAVERSAELSVALLAVLAVGAAYVPLDPDAPAERRRLVLEDAGARALLAAPETAEALAVDLPAIDPAAASVEGAPDDEPLPAIPADQAAYLIYTSGSTGRPKGVVVSHRAIAHRLDWMQERYGLAPAERVLQKTPVGFDVSVWELFWPLREGATLVMAEPGSHRDPAALADQIEAEGVTTLHFVPSMLRLFLDQGGLEPGGRCRSLRRVVASGEALGADLVTRWAELFPGVALHNLYGPTETAVDVSHHETRPGEDPVPIGRPVDGTRLHVVGPGVSELPVGASGELLVGGVQLARGYHGRPATTAAAFVPDPLGDEPGGRLYRTGDRVVRREDGALVYQGRIDHQVKVRGVRVEPGEVAAVLLAQPEVADAVVVGRPLGADTELVAYVVPRPDTATDGDADLVETLRDRLAATLPAALVPARTVLLDALPLGPTGKVDRSALPEPAAVSEPAAAERGAPVARTAIETVVVDVLGDVLGRPLGVDDDFFAAGGHSLTAARAVARLRQTFGVALSVAALFERPTPARLARAVEAALGGDETAVDDTVTPLPRSAPGGVGDAFPLSFAQQRLWLLDQIEPGRATYNIPVTVVLDGTVDRPALVAALETIVERHEVLRTTYGLDGEEPVQRIGPVAGALEVEEIDLVAATRDLPAVAARALLVETLRTTAARPFDLARGPVIRAALVPFGGSPERTAFQVTVHHVAADGWSLRVLARELSELYRARVEGRPSRLEPLPVQVADAAVHERRVLSGERLERLLGYWRERLADLPAEHSLPTDRPRPARPSGRGATLDHRFGRSLSDALATLGRRSGATPFMVLLALFDTLLYRLGGEDDVVVGTDSAHRARPETGGLIGFFVDQLVLRLDLAGAPSFAALVERARQTAIEAYAHDGLPFERLVEEVGAQRDLARHPVFQILFAFENLPEASLDLPAVGVERLALGGSAARFDLMVVASDTPEGLRFAAEYATDLFDRTTVRRLFARLQVLAASAVAAPETPIDRLPLLEPAERHQVRIEWNDSRRRAPFVAVDRALAARAEASPERPAVSGPDRSYTYGELEDAVARATGNLQAAGVGEGTVVPVLAERGARFLALLVALGRAGAVYLPLDPRHPAERHRHLVAASGASIVVADGHLAPLLAGGDGATVPRLLDPAALVTDLPPTDLPAPPAPDPRRVAYALFTSGSTGLPKGALVEHGGMVNHLASKIDALDLGPDDVIAQTASQSFDISVWQFLVAIPVGARVEVYPDEVTLDPPRLLAAVDGDRVTVFETVPSVLRMMLDETDDAPPALENLRWLIPTGEALGPELARRWLERHPAVPLVNAYGPTECSDDVTHERIAAHPRLAQLLATGPVPIGRPIRNARLHVVDRNLAPVGIGVPGELVVGGGVLGRGYLDDPRRTALAWSPDAVSGVSAGSRGAGGRLYRTGDVARFRADGRLEFLGRVDHQVKVRGHRIELGEIEAALERHPGVSQAVVTAWNPSGRALRRAAYVVGAPGTEPPDRVGLQDFLRRSLPDSMVPSGWVFLDELPITVSGKVDRKALPEPAAPAGGGATHAPPVSELERLVAGIWEELLEVGRVGLDDNFFDLGGHSLSMARVKARLEGRLERQVPMVELFSHTTVRSLAGFLDRGDDAQAAVEPTAEETERMDAGRARLGRLRRRPAASMEDGFDG